MKPTLAMQLRRWAALALLTTAAAAAHATPVAAGQTLAPLMLEDPHGRPVHVDAGTRRVVFSADKAASDRVNTLLAAQPAGTLARLGAVVLADISGMPALVTRMFALPKLRELPFPLGLAHESAQVAHLPREAGAVTVLALEGGRVTAVTLARDEAQLRAALGLAP